MRATEFIEKLQALIAEHGDLEVTLECGEFGEIENVASIAFKERRMVVGWGEGGSEQVQTSHARFEVS